MCGINSSLQMDVSNGRNEECPTCAHHRFEFLDRSSNQQVIYTTLCGRDTVQINPRNRMELNMEEMADRLRKNGKVIGNPYLIQFFPDEEIKDGYF